MPSRSSRASALGSKLPALRPLRCVGFEPFAGGDDGRLVFDHPRFRDLLDAHATCPSPHVEKENVSEDVIHNLAGDDDATKCDSKQLAEFLCRQVSPRMRTAPCCYRTPASLR